MKTFYAILFSIGVTSVVSSIFGCAGYLYGIGFWVPFLVVTGLQLVIGALWNTYIENKLAAKMQIERESFEAAKKLADSIQNVDLACAYCAARNTIQLNMAEENSFKCINCNNANKVQVQFSTIRTTEPVVRDDLLSKIFKLQTEEEKEEKEKVKK